MFRLLLAAAVCSSLDALSCMAARAENPAGGVPRYQLKVREELRYRQSSEFHGSKGASAGTSGTKTDWQVWVIRHNDNGSWRIILRSSERSWQTDSKDKKSDQPANNSLAYCDVFPDGGFTPNESLGDQMN